MTYGILISDLFMGTEYLFIGEGFFFNIQYIDFFTPYDFSDDFWYLVSS